MKKSLYTFFSAAFILLLSGCGDRNQKSTNTVSQQKSVTDVLQQGMAEADRAAESSMISEPTDTVMIPTILYEAPTPEIFLTSIAAEASNAEEGIDIDLTKMSSTMIYAEIYSILCSPQDYIGKKIRMRGEFSGFYDKKQDKNYYSCLIRDAMACCAQGLEFVLNDDYSYPEDYPNTGDEVTITGVFASYQERNLTFYHIADAVME